MGFNLAFKGLSQILKKWEVRLQAGFVGPGGSSCGKHILCSTKEIIHEKRKN